MSFRKKGYIWSAVLDCPKAATVENQSENKKKVKSIPAFLKEDAPWGRNKTYELIKSGDLKTVRIMGRQYVVMASFDQLISV
jgi:hypothetical protein